MTTPAEGARGHPQARGPNVILDSLERDWDHAAGRLRRLMHPDHHGAPQPPPPAMPHNETQEVTPMSLLAEIEDHLKNAVAKFEAVDHAALDTLDRVLANPATAEIFGIAGQLTHLPPEDLATGASVLRMILTAAGGQAPASISGDAQPQAVPAGPVVGGQA